jgi:hypothetical protein
MFVVIAVPETTKTRVLATREEQSEMLLHFQAAGLEIRNENCLQRRDGSWFGVRSIWYGNRLHGVWMEH